MEEITGSSNTVMLLCYRHSAIPVEHGKNQPAVKFVHIQVILNMDHCHCWMLNITLSVNRLIK